MRPLHRFLRRLRAADGLGGPEHAIETLEIAPRSFIIEHERSERCAVEFAPRLMPLQVDEGGGVALRRLLEALGVCVRTNTATAKITGRLGQVSMMEFADGAPITARFIAPSGSA